MKKQSFICANIQNGVIFSKSFRQNHPLGADDRKDLSSSGVVDPPDNDSFQRWLSCIDLLCCPVAEADDADALGGSVGCDLLA